MLEPFQLITILLALWGAFTGSLALYFRYAESKAKKPSLIAWVLSSSYVFQKEKERRRINMHLEVDLLIQNKGGKDTTVSNIFAEVRVDKPLSVTHSAEGTIFYKEPDGKLVSAPVSLSVGDSKNLHLAFALEGVDPLAVERSVPTLNTKLSLQMPIKVSFTIRHTQGSLGGDWPVYGKHQELHQRLIQWMCQKDMREGKPHWVQR